MNDASARLIDLVIRAKGRDLGGGFKVRRVLPATERRMVGPFIFLDHMGPIEMAPGSGFDVRPHPHINLATVTYLFEGAIHHKDSLGNDLTIRPGAVNWMSAGRGIVHSERSGAEERARGQTMHGIQLWVALPRQHEEDEPSFTHVPADAIPEVQEPGARLRVILGTAYGQTSPAPVHMPMFYVEAMMSPGSSLTLPAYDERAVYVAVGAIRVDDQPFEEGDLVVFQPGTVKISAPDDARVMLLGGAPMDGPRHIFWNFVSSSKERIERAKLDWKEGRFPKVPGDEIEFIPLPE